MTGPRASLPQRGVSEAPLSAGGACIPRRSISDRSASLASSVSAPASPAISFSSPSSKLAYHSASRRRSFCSSVCPMIAASYPQPPGAASPVLEARSSIFPPASCTAAFPGSCAFPPGTPSPEPADQTLTPSLFNAFPLHSNANNKVIYMQCTSVLFSLVFAYTEPRPLVPIRSRSVHSDLRSATYHPRLFLAPAALAVCPALSHHFRYSRFHFLILTNSFRINTCGPARKCGKQRTYRKSKSFRCNTCKKHRGEGWLWLTRNPRKDFYPEGTSRAVDLFHESSVIVTSHPSCATLER